MVCEDHLFNGVAGSASTFRFFDEDEYEGGI